MTGSVPSFEPPAPGSWTLDMTHWTRPVTRFVSELFPPTFRQAFAEGLRRYGFQLEAMEYAFVNGCPYYCLRPVGAPPDAVGHPPREVWDEMARTHPDVRARLAQSEVTFARKLWREDVARWDAEVKPVSVRDGLALQAIDPRGLGTDALATHLERCFEHVRRQLHLHHLFNVPAMLPVGDFIAHAEEWAGCPLPMLLDLLRGTSAVSRGDADVLQLVGRAIRRDPAARRVLDRGEPAKALAALCDMPGGVGTAVRGYLDVAGHRLVNGEDLGEPCALELPEVLVRVIRVAVDGAAADHEQAEWRDREATVRAAVPPARRAEFAELLAEARVAYRLRDERGIFCDLWAYGLMRRAILAAGERLVAAGRLGDPEHLVEATYGEGVALFGGADHPDAGELAERSRRRRALSLADAPSTLGPPPGAPLPLEWLPAAAARLERALQTYIGAMLLTVDRPSETRLVRGTPVSSGVYEGRARVVRSTADFARVEPGDVLVTTSTSAAFNVLLPLLGAIVTDRGGLLSHAAIVARECGIPGVVGCGSAVRTVPDGARVRVDGTTGEVQVLA